MTEQMAVVIAQGLAIGDIPTSDEEVFDGSGFFAINEIDKMIESGKIDDCQTLSGLYLTEKWLKKRKG